MRCSFVVACEGMVVADLQEPMGAYALDNFIFIHVLLFLHSHYYILTGGACMLQVLKFDSS